MPQDFWTPADIADQINKDRTTIHRWTDRYSEFLSDHATNRDERLYTERDVHTMLFVDEERRAKTSMDDIALKLASLSRTWEATGQEFEFPDRPFRLDANLPGEVAEQLTIMAANLKIVAHERDQALEERDEYKQQLETANAEIEQLKEQLHRLEGRAEEQISRDDYADLLKQIGRLEAKIEMLEDEN